jgi:hypothetical protein
LWTSIITGRYPPPVLEATEHDLDPVTPFIPALIVADGRFPLLPAWDARAYLLVLQRFSEPIGIVSAISEKPLRRP